jgi:biotin carboxyl carrier protein
MLDDKLKELLEFAKTTDLQELEWEKNGAKINFRRGEVKAAPTKPSSTPGASPVVEETAAPETLYIRSTMVGTFFRADSSDRPPLVVEGTMVVSGQPVASIEAMKIRKDVVSQLGCRIVKSLVADGHAVEYGQPLFEVEMTNGTNGHV